MKKRATLFIILSCIVFAVVFSVAGFFIYTLVLRTAYKATALEINEAFRTNKSVILTRGTDSFEISCDTADYYNKFLLDRNTVVFSRKAVPTTEKTISLEFTDSVLSFTGLEDGTAIAISWRSKDAEKHYIVRSMYTFTQLTAYFNNYLRRSE